jgi:serine/threonine-protein kinase
VLDSKYEIISLLGAGGMGAVYRARRVHIGDEVAVKILRQELVAQELSIERFRREARAAALLHHTNIVTIHDFGEGLSDGVSAFIVMELLEGESIRAILKREGSIEPKRAVLLMRDICAGVGAGHRLGVVHRDLKPDNVMVLPPGDEHGREIVKVVDFGIAKLLDLASVSTLTETGSMLGTVYYMSPEQCRGEHLDSRSDVYSLGAMFYEMLAGRPPFVAATSAGIVAKHLTEDPPPLDETPAIQASLKDLVMRSLAKNPDERPADARELARQLETVIDPPSYSTHDQVPSLSTQASQNPPSSSTRPVPVATLPVSKKRPAALGLAALLIAVALAVGLLKLYQHFQSRLIANNAIEYNGPMILIPAGEFTMGDDNHSDVEKPAHKVSLPAYYLDKFEVTNAEYKKFCDDTRRPYPPDPWFDSDYFNSKPNAPVLGATWYDAAAYAGWAGKRLPTEEEWEKAASWSPGKQTKHQWPWGDNAELGRANLGLHAQSTSTVGRYTGDTSAYGIQDMAGNVSEWVDAFAQPYEGNQIPNQEYGKQYRVIRGGHFRLDLEYGRTTRRVFGAPEFDELVQKNRAFVVGFRCAISADDNRLSKVVNGDEKLSEQKKSEISPSVKSSSIGTGSIYWQMSQDEQRQFIGKQSERIAAMLGPNPYRFDQRSVDKIKQALDNYVVRKDSLSPEMFQEGLRPLYSRASIYAPFIIQAFNERRVPAIIGLYIPMIESEYHPCSEGQFGGNGLFAFSSTTGLKYGLELKDRCDPQKNSRAAARHLDDLMSEFGSDSASVTLVLLSYVLGDEEVRANLRQLLAIGNRERSFWALANNEEKLDESFRQNGIKYVPSFFAAAIIGENPQAFDLQIQPLSSYGGTKNQPSAR